MWAFSDLWHLLFFFLASRKCHFFYYCHCCKVFSIWFMHGGIKLLNMALSGFVSVFCFISSQHERKRPNQVSSLQGCPPVSIQMLLRPHAPTWTLCSTTVTAIAQSKVRSTKSRLFSIFARQWWNKLLTNVSTAESLHIFHNWLKTNLFRSDLDPASQDSC